MVDEDNPFADPSIQNLTRNYQSNQQQQPQQTLEDYNPFAPENTQIKMPAIIPTSSSINAKNISSNSFPDYGSQSTLKTSSTSQQPLNLSEIQKQQQELEKRAAELDRRERMLNTNTNASENNYVSNFPPLPMWCPSPFKPCFYQDISLEIPIEFQKWVRFLFYLWLFYTFTLAFNIVASLVVFITTDTGKTFFLSIVYFILFSCMSYVCWFRPAYKAFRSDSSINFMLFFFVFFCQIVINCIESIGFNDSGFCGIVQTITVFSKSTDGSSIVAGVFSLLTTLFFVSLTTANVLILMKIHGLYRNTSASFEKAQQEFATSMMSNKNVQNAAATMVTESAKASMKQAAGRF